MNTCKRENCGLSTPNPKYCSRSCAVKVNNLGRSRNRNNKNVYLSNCKRCLLDITYPLKTFCSKDCSSQFKRENLIESWLNDTWDGNSKHGLSPAIRRYLIKEAQFRCLSPDCAVPGGWSVINEFTGLVPLEIDHIDGDCYNNTRGNLLVLCPCCHSLTPTYKGANRGSGRAYRGKYDQYQRVDTDTPGSVD